MYSLIFIDADDMEVSFESGSLLEGLDLLEKLRGGLAVLNVKKIYLKPKESENRI